MQKSITRILRFSDYALIFSLLFSFLLCGSESLLSSILSSFSIITQNFKLGKKNFTKAKIGSNAAVLCGFSRFFRPFEREHAAYHHINARRREEKSGGKRVNGIGVSLCYQRRDDKSQRRGGKERGKDGHRREGGKDPPLPFIVRPAVQNSKRLRPISSLNALPTLPSTTRTTISQVAETCASLRCPPVTLPYSLPALMCRWR